MLCACAHLFIYLFLIGKQTFSISPARVSTYIYYIARKLKPIKKSLHYANPLFLRICMGTNTYLFHASTPHVFLVPIFVRLTYIRLCLLFIKISKKHFLIVYVLCIIYASITHRNFIRHTCFCACFRAFGVCSALQSSMNF